MAACCPFGRASTTSKGSFEDTVFDNSNSSNMASFVQPPAEGAPIEEIRRYANAMREQAIQFSKSLASTTQLLQQSLSLQSEATTHKKRPELPPWDPKNLEAWICRVENAFVRASITEAKDKFAHLESVISVDLHPTINKFFNGTASKENFDSLLAFLRERYGRTKEQKVRATLEGVRRNGRLPTDLMALLKDQVDDITIEDILKVHLYSELPQSVRENLADKLESLNSDELAKAADAFFDHDGALRASNNRSVNAVSTDSAESEPLFTPAFDETLQDISDINAVHNRNNRSSNNGSNGRGGYNNNRSGRQRSQSANRQGSRSDSARSQSRPKPVSNAPTNPDHCFFHQKWGAEARNCRAPCSFSAGSGGLGRGNPRGLNPAPGNFRGGRR